MTSGIYLFTNLINNKNYVGQSIDIERRWGAHSRAKEECLISRAIRKYGWDNFSKQILIVVEDQSDMDMYEEKCIQIYDCIRPNGYNILPGAKESRKGIPLSQETKIKLSIAQKNSESGKANRESIAARRRGKPGKSIPHTEETKAKLRELKLGKRHGRAVSEEHKQLMNEGKRRRWDAIKATAEWQNNHPAKKYKFSEESRKKMSEAQKLRNHKMKEAKALSLCLIDT